MQRNYVRIVKLITESGKNMKEKESNPTKYPLIIGAMILELKRRWNVPYEKSSQQEFIDKMKEIYQSSPATYTGEFLDWLEREEK